MELLIVSSAPLIHSKMSWKAYTPYVNEIELWSKYVEQVKFCCPTWQNKRDLLTKEITFNIEEIIELNDFNVKSFTSTLKSILGIALNLIIIFRAMKTTDHIHLRCPGNIGLLGCFVQIFFPKKTKTAKYAGNWDPNAKQPWSYRLQKWILSNTLLTKNMKVLVYGEWPNQSKNIVPFFTASYSENEIVKTFCKSKFIIESQESEQKEQKRNKVQFSDVINFLFVGTLTKNKRPQLCLEVIQQLKQQGYQVKLALYGEGTERTALEKYILDFNLQREVILKGNVSKEELKLAYQNNHFLMFFSQSEGWPKAVAEAMFWGCVPITTAVSCVPIMINYGSRGTLVNADKNEIIMAIKKYLNNPEIYKIQALNGMEWSQQYTLDRFEKEIEKLLI